MSTLSHLEVARGLVPPDPSPHGVEQRLRLLVDLLQHVVPERAEAQADLLQPKVQGPHIPAAVWALVDRDPALRVKVPDVKVTEVHYLEGLDDLFSQLVGYVRMVNCLNIAQII